ncbi:hypothetical protein GGI04_005439 [Coemansia thaxteri]|nr:hypothetical protein GGI04_005439 [Coemansia thaxteri]KAJ2461979.1 hypothetical protein GGI02_005567 [Coemansia sp. RSA 2322]KAJ2477516.1 hypothetical protein EV174_004599 [Coemansia sp. RSA 2320]
MVHLLRTAELDAVLARVVEGVLRDSALRQEMELDFARVAAATCDRRVVEEWRRLQRGRPESGECSAAGLFAGVSDPPAPGLLERQWAYVVRARQLATPADVLRAWMRIAVAPDCVPALLSRHFGLRAAGGLRRQQAVERDMAADVAAFLRAPLADADVARARVVAEGCLESKSTSAAPGGQ